MPAFRNRLYPARHKYARHTCAMAEMARWIVCFAGLCFGLDGCHSAYVTATVSNHTAAPISVVQIEYPSASFGTQAIAPGSEFHYRFKILGSGPMKITYTDAAEHEQKATGPTLHEGTEGNLTIDVAPDGVHWQAPSPGK